MRKGLIWIGSWLIIKLFSLRYSFEIKGLDRLNLKRKGGILFLPNHPAEIDPLTVYNLLARKFNPRPLVIEHFYYLRGARFFMDLVRALPIPNFELSANSWKIRQIEKSLKKVSEEVQKGENFLIYPSGHLKREGHENVGGNSFIHSILESCPDVQVVLVRTDGLWGSSFSCALTGNSPDFWKMISQGIKKALKNGIFFMPRRKVTITFEANPEGFPFKGTRLELNQFLEEWYNRYLNDEGKIVGSEPVRLVSYSRFSEDLPLITREEKKTETIKEIKVPDHIREDVYRELKKLSGVKEIKEEMDLSRDLGLDSLDLASVHAFLDQHYDVEAARPAELKTVYDLFVLVVEGSVSKPKIDTKNLKDYEWPQEAFRPKVDYPKGKTIPECFLETADRMGKAMACGDDMTKILNYQEMKIGLHVFGKKFQKLEGDYVAVMLPSSVGCYIMILSILIAGKIPVVLNWTAGERSLKFAAELLDLKQIFSARRFLERVEALELGELEEKLVLMEDFRQGISLWDKLSGFFLSKAKKKKWIKRFHLDRIKEEDPAVILFTSGTENYPKAVPLSHKNIISSHRASLSCAHIDKSDILYGALPPFHSFGFSLTGLFPLLAGLRVFYSPDPTDTHAMARDSFYRKITIHCLAPSFYKNLFRIASPRQLKSVRLFVAGAEKAPEALFEHVKRLGGNKEMIEGYGITECSPIVTLNRQGVPRKGVGQPIPGVELCVIHPETHEKIPNDQQGEICIRGPNVFSGYLGKDAPNPFIEIEGKQWYRSGDIGSIEADGSLILGGRLKRFVKIGGEMVSLVALEEELTKFARGKGLIKGTEEEPQLAIGVCEGDKPSLILFTTFPLTKEEANAVLKEGGFARIVKVAQCYQIDEIPMTGTGKIQLRRLNELIKEKHA
ncbi:MAG: AMP-binding protein [Chlamydiales bacterium]|nr:AMP-binding protein [Chlamydiales bacterium]